MTKKTKNPAPTLMSKTAYAEHRNVTLPYISKLVRSGKIPTVDGKIDPVAADAILDKKGGTGKLNAFDEDARLKKWKADLAELEFNERAGKLVAVEVVEKELNKAFTVVRRRILSMPTKLTPVIQAEATGVGIRNVLEAEATEILQELSSYDPESGKTDARPSGANGNVKKASRKPKAAGKTKRKRVGRKKPTA